MLGPIILVWDVPVQDWIRSGVLHIAYQTCSYCNHHQHHFNVHFLLKLIKSMDGCFPKAIIIIIIIIWFGDTVTVSSLQNVIQTQKCELCREYAKPNRCVFKCFAKVSKLKEEDLKPTGKTFQLLGSATAKDLKQHKVDNQPLPFSLKAVVYPWEYWNKVLVMFFVTSTSSD